MSGRRKRQLGMLLVLALILCTYAVHSSVLGLGFVNFDDDVIVYENPRVQAGVTLEGVWWALGTTHSGHWHPVTWLSHMMDCQLYGLNPGGHHLSNLLIHILNVVLLFGVLRAMTGRMWESALVASLFAVHPLNVESVAWVAERKNVLSTTFWFLALWAYAGYARRPGWGRYGLVLLAFTVGLMTKSMLVTLPFVLLLLDYWPLRRVQSGRVGHLLLEKAPLLVLSGAASFMAYHAAASVGAVESSELFPLAERIGNALVAYVSYIGKMIWPEHLAVFYPHPGAIPLWKVTGAAVLLLSVTSLVIRARERHPYLAMGWFWYVGTLVPVIGFVQAGAQAMADRYAYVPLIGLFVMAAWGISRSAGSAGAMRPMKKAVLATIMVMILTGLSVAGRMETDKWANSVSLFQNAVANTKDNYLAHNNLGQSLAEKGRLHEAMAHYGVALRISPRNADVYHTNMGMALAQQGRYAEAIPHYMEALRRTPGLLEAHINLGLALADQGETDQALQQLELAVRLRPQHARARFVLSVLLTRKGQTERAMAEWREALRLQPNLVESPVIHAGRLETRGMLNGASRPVLGR